MTESVRVFIAIFAAAIVLLGGFWGLKDAKRVKRYGTEQNRFSRFKWPIIDTAGVLAGLLMVLVFEGLARYAILAMATLQVFIAIQSWRVVLLDGSR
jgi:hypothetical protein